MDNTQRRRHSAGGKTNWRVSLGNGITGRHNPAPASFRGSAGQPEYKNGGRYQRLFPVRRDATLSRAMRVQVMIKRLRMIRNISSCRLSRTADSCQKIRIMSFRLADCSAKVSVSSPGKNHEKGNPLQDTSSS